MDKIKKALQKLSPKERETIKDILVQIQSGGSEGLDVKKLRGRDDIYRVRKGSLRVIYQKKSTKTSILLIERRSTNTYK